MKAWEYYAVTYDGAVYCTECLPHGVDVESDTVRPIFASDEVDCYPVCDRCGRVHDYMGLTSDGKRYVERYVDEEGMEWKIGDRVTWEEPIGGGGYVTATGTIYGIDPTEETAIVYVEEPFAGDTVEIRFMHLERIPRK